MIHLVYLLESLQKKFMGSWLANEVVFDNSCIVVDGRATVT